MGEKHHLQTWNAKKTIKHSSERLLKVLISHEFLTVDTTEMNRTRSDEGWKIQCNEVVDQRTRWLKQWIRSHDIVYEEWL